MREFPNSQVPMSLLDSTDYVPNLYTSEKEAIIYLQLLTDNEFMYTNILNYDAIDYEHLIYIEQTFGYDNEIKNLISQIKNNICNNYILKQKYLERIKINTINLDKNNRYQNISEIHLPEYWLEDFRREVINETI